MGTPCPKGAETLGQGVAVLIARARVPSGQQLPSPAPHSPRPAAGGMYLPWAPPTACLANWQVTMPGLCPCTMMLPCDL